MLSFLREQATEQKIDAQSNPSDQDQQPYLTVASRSRQLQRSTTTLIVLFVLGVLCLWLMIKKSSPQGASASEIDTEQAKIESAIARLTGVKAEMFNRMDEIVKKFYEFSEVLQVKVNELAKNPFELELFLPNVPVESDGEQTAPQQPQLLQQQKIAQQAKDLQLMGIMKSETGNCCMINYKLLYPGDRIGDFQLVEIADNSVKLQWQPKDADKWSSQAGSMQIVLRLSQ